MLGMLVHRGLAAVGVPLQHGQLLPVLVLPSMCKVQLGSAADIWPQVMLFGGLASGVHNSHAAGCCRQEHWCSCHAATSGQLNEKAMQQVLNAKAAFVMWLTFRSTRMMSASNLCRSDSRGPNGTGMATKSLVSSGGSCLQGPTFSGVSLVGWQALPATEYPD